MNEQPLVSIIIPAYNEAKVIKTLLISVLKQSYKNIEIIIVDDNSTDNTAKIAREFTQNVFTKKHAERSVQRNFGAKKSRGKYLFFLDADMQLTRDVVLNCLNVCSVYKMGGVIIPEISHAKTFWERVKAFERSFYNKDGDETTDAARFFPRKVFEEVGGYDEKITGPEDWDLPESIKRSGYKIVRIKSKIIHHERVLSLFSLIRKKYYYGLKSHRYIKKQNISLFSSKTVYFLRPVFYKNWRRLISNPILSFSMFIMFSFEIMGGGLGFLIGKYFKK